MRYWLFLFGFVFILSSCSNGTTSKQSSSSQKSTYPTVTIKKGRKIINAGSTAQYIGKPGRLVIVSKNTVYTEDMVQLIDSVFNKAIRPYYPKTPYFEVVQKTPEDFKSVSTRLRNVIDLKIVDSIEKGNPKMTIYKNYYAKTQLYTKLRAHDLVDLYHLLQKQIGFLFNLYDRQEWLRAYYKHKETDNKVTRNKIKKKFGVNLVLPKDFKYESIDSTYAILIFPNRTRQLELQGSGFSTTKTNAIISGVMIWQYPYKDSSQFTPKHLLMMRDTILKHYAKHAMQGVYMGTQYHPAAYPIHTKLKIGEVTGYQFRGLYKFTGRVEPSGGRFWGFQFKHPYRNTIVAISGYIGAPPGVVVKYDINRIRAIIYSLQPVQ